MTSSRKNKPIIEVKHLSKEYAIGSYRSYKRLSESISNALKNPLTSLKGLHEQKDTFWALKDINLEVERGEVLGIIGRNGAGKSTLLKVLARITHPTEGEVRLRGRVGSLLEVGTGFHPELTGRENIYFNGSILGMKKREIDDKFDEIVKFSGIERHLDTPTKRYSSGMNVRLAFSVAAHLDPEILLVDEVLAVGDAEFQKKCLGKMSEVAEGGRTVLFVSHSMPMISSLCNQCILLETGKLKTLGETGDVIAAYQISGSDNPSFFDYSQSSNIPGDHLGSLISGWIERNTGEKSFEIEINEFFFICMRYRIHMDVPKTPYPNFHVYDSIGQCVFVSSPCVNYEEPLKKGEFLAKCEIPGNFLNDGLFSVHLALTFHHSGIHVSFWEKHALSFNITDPIDGICTRSTGYSGRIPGIIRPILSWTIEGVE